MQKMFSSQIGTLGWGVTQRDFMLLRKTNAYLGGWGTSWGQGGCRGCILEQCCCLCSPNTKVSNERTAADAAVVPIVRITYPCLETMKDNRNHDIVLIAISRHHSNS